MSKKESKKRVKTEVKKIVRNVISEEEIIEKLKTELKGYSYLTPLIITDKYNVSLGVSKRVLRRLVAMGLIKLISNNPRTPVYMVGK